MKHLLLSVLLLLPSLAEARDCTKSVADRIVVKAWTAKPSDSGFVPSAHVALTLENTTDSAVRMIDGTVFFDDVLGRSIVNISISEDARIDAKGTFQQSGTYQSFGGNIERLTQVDQSDVVVTACVKAMVQADGTVVNFGDK